MGRRNSLALVDVAILVLAVGAGVVGAVRGFERHGILGAVVGFPIGIVVGVVAGMVLLVCLAAVLFAGVVGWTFLTEGREGVREIFRDPPVPPTPGEPCEGEGTHE